MNDRAGDDSQRELLLNGAARRTAAPTVAALLEELGYAAGQAGLAVAVNGAVVPRGRWADHTLRAADRVDLVGAVQGG